MQDNAVYAKTAAGREEIRSRALGLPMAARAILLMVDGQRTVSTMRTIIAGTKAPADVLDGLVAQGLIEPRPEPSAAAAPLPIPASAPVAAPGPAPAPVLAAAPAPVVAPVPPPMAARPAPPIALRPPEVVAAATMRGMDLSPPPVAGLPDGPLDLILPTIFGMEGTDPAAQMAAAPMQAAVAEAVETAPAAPPPPPNRYEHLYSMMNEIVRDFLAPHRRYFFQLKIERCTTADELLELLHDLQTVLAKARGDAFASDVITRLRSAAG